MTTAAPTTVNQLSSASIFFLHAGGSDLVMPEDVKGLYVTVDGNLSVTDHAQNPNTVVLAVTAGQLLPIRPKQMNAASTATVLVLAG